MTRLLLDTTVLIDAERDEAAFDAVIGDDDDVAIAAVTVAELLVGVRLATARRRPAREAFVDDILSAIPVIDYDSTVAVAHADLLAVTRKAGTRRGAHDLIIAATASATSRLVVSRDTSAFRDLPGVRILSTG